MLFKLKQSESSFVRPRVTPDPDQAAQLQRKFEALAYNPSNGFHRDMKQGKPRLRLVPKFAR
jgi:hypothetical protein